MHTVLTDNRAGQWPAPYKRRREGVYMGVYAPPTYPRGVPGWVSLLLASLGVCKTGETSPFSLPGWV